MQISPSNLLQFDHTPLARIPAPAGQNDMGSQNARQQLNCQHTLSLRVTWCNSLTFKKTTIKQPTLCSAAGLHVKE